MKDYELYSTPVPIKLAATVVKMITAAMEEECARHGVLGFSMKCWDDGLIEDGYSLPSNWFADPPLPENKI